MDVGTDKFFRSKSLDFHSPKNNYPVCQVKKERNMRTLTNASVLIAVLFSLGTMQCRTKQQSAISEFKKVITEIILLQEKAIDGMDKAKTGKEGALVLDSFREEMIKVKANAEAVEAKYPETKTSEPPQEIEVEVKRGMEISRKLSVTLQKSMEKFADSREFLEAAKRMSSM